MATKARETGAGYIQSLLDALGARDPLTVMAATPAAVKDAVAGLDHARLTRPEAPGKWSILDVVQHLADSELVCGYRVRMIVSHPTPPIQGFDQDLWARELEYDKRDLGEALEEFRTLRESNVRLLRLLSSQKRERFGIHSERGEESVAKMMGLYAGHDLIHLKQIERIKNK